MSDCEACGMTYDSPEYWEMRGREERQVEIEEVERVLAVLAHNLATAAGLERSRQLGVLDALQWLARQPMWPTWEPGCRKPAPETYEVGALCKATWPSLHREYGTVDSSKEAP
jgi:hypothetical protein